MHQLKSASIRVKSPATKAIQLDCQKAHPNRRRAIERRIRRSLTPIFFLMTSSKRAGLTDLTSNSLIDGMKKIDELEPLIHPTVSDKIATTSFPFEFVYKFVYNLKRSLMKKSSFAKLAGDLQDMGAIMTLGQTVNCLNLSHDMPR
jgi:hypothetical protein